MVAVALNNDQTHVLILQDAEQNQSQADGTSNSYICTRPAKGGGWGRKGGSRYEIDRRA